FRLAPNGTETILYNFTGFAHKDGDGPFGGVIRDRKGNLYGTTEYGGDNACSETGIGCGVVFRIAPDGTETVLHIFEAGSDGSRPFGGVVQDLSGNLYGTTSGGGASSCGTVFSVSPHGAEAVLHAFDCS